MPTGGTGCGSSNVIGLSMRAFEVKHPAIAQIDAYWEALRGDRNVPLRSEVDPRGIDRALENAFILERIAPNVARFRLAGMVLNELMGMEVRGMPMTSLFLPEGRRRVTEILEHVFEEPAKARLRLVGEDVPGRHTMTGEIILLPLRSDLGDISRALGCLVTDGMIGKPPSRFTVNESEVTPLSGSLGRLRARSYTSPTHSEPQTLQMNEDQKRYTQSDRSGSSDRPTSRPPYLKLVHDTDKPK